MLTLKNFATITSPSGHVLVALGLVTALLVFTVTPARIPNPEVRTDLDAAQSPTLAFSSANAYAHLVAQLDCGTRVPGTPGHQACIRYLHSALAAHANVTLHNYTVHGIACTNVLGKINADAEHDSIVILGAHFDSRAIAEKDPDPARRGDPIPGANDGASGVAALLELARVFATDRAHLTPQVWIVFFDAEDQGDGGMAGWGWCEGSELFVRDLDAFLGPGENQADISAMILLDMVGGTHLEFVREGYSSTVLYNHLFNAGRDLGYTSAFPQVPRTKYIYDDHKPFVDAHIPAYDLIIDFTDTSEPGWPYHHTHGDNLAHIDQASLGITGRTVEYYFQTYHYSSLPAGGTGSTGTGSTAPPGGTSTNGTMTGTWTGSTNGTGTTNGTSTPGDIDVPGAHPGILAVAGILGTGVLLARVRSRRKQLNAPDHS